MLSYSRFADTQRLVSCAGVAPVAASLRTALPVELLRLLAALFLAAFTDGVTVGGNVTSPPIRTMRYGLVFRLPPEPGVKKTPLSRSEAHAPSCTAPNTDAIALGYLSEQPLGT